MQFFHVLVPNLLLASAVLTLGSCTECPLGLKPVVTGTIRLGKPLKRIAVPGGVRNGEFFTHHNTFGPKLDMMIVTPIIGGILTGVINATIEGGVAYPQVFGNGTVSAPQILLYGTTADNSSFLIQEAGVGSLAHQNTRIVSLSSRLAGIKAMSQKISRLIFN